MGKNNIHDKVFMCPKCGNKTLIPVEGNEDIIGIGYHDLCICEICRVRRRINGNKTTVSKV